MIVLRSTYRALESKYNKLARDFDALKSLNDTLEALLFKHDEHWQENFDGKNEVLVSTDQGFVATKSLVGRRLLIKVSGIDDLAGDGVIIDYTEDPIEVQVMEVAGSNFKYTYSKPFRRHPALPARIQEGWASFDVYDVLAVLPNIPAEASDEG